MSLAPFGDYRAPEAPNPYPRVGVAHIMQYG